MIDPGVTLLISKLALFGLIVMMWRAARKAAREKDKTDA
jgi:hypothetical protein